MIPTVLEIYQAVVITMLSSLTVTLNAVDYDTINCMATAIYFEARDENISGKHAVASVIQNRVNDDRYPDNPCDVVKQNIRGGKNRCEFSFSCDGKPEHVEFLDMKDRFKKDDYENFVEAVEIAVLKLYSTQKDYDITNGALFYYAPDLVDEPEWLAKRINKGMYFKLELGNHIFVGPLEVTVSSIGG